MELFERLEIKDWLDLNAKLQKKKNALRKLLKEKGVLKKDKKNDFDKYSYFSEAGYKELFTELLSNSGLELTSNEQSYTEFETTSEKMPNGRKVVFEFRLTDIDTGFFETSYITGEAMDKGDKAGYKADTGAIKYYLANTFLVATGDDPETESPEGKKKPAKDNGTTLATANQVATIKKLYDEVNIQAMLNYYKVGKLEDLTVKQASVAIANKRKKEENPVE